jgi:hypothetical protein
MKLGAEVAVTTDEVSRRQQRDLDFVAAVVPPQPEPEVHSYSGNDFDSDGKPVSPPLCWEQKPLLMFTQSMKSE